MPRPTHQTAQAKLVEAAFLKKDSEYECNEKAAFVLLDLQDSAIYG